MLTSPRQLRSRSILNLGLVLVWLLLCGAHLEKSTPLLQQLDGHYYFPQHLGLKRLSLRIHWAQLDALSDSDDKHFLNNPPVRFVWSRNNPEGSLTLDDPEHKTSALRELEIIRTLTNYREMFLPLPLQEKLEDYRLESSKEGKGFYEVRFVTRTPHPILEYQFKVDINRWVIDELYLQREHAPLQVASRLRYVDRDGLCQVVESLSRFSAGGQEYEETVSFDYEQVNGFWLPTRIHQQLKENGRTVTTNVFRITNHKVN